MIACEYVDVNTCNSKKSKQTLFIHFVIDIYE